MLEITNREFPGILIKDPDPEKDSDGNVIEKIKYDETNRGRYLVYIPEIMYNIHDQPQNGIWCVNHVHKYRDTYIDEVVDKKDKSIGGQYFPLQEDMHVIVKFFSNDYRSGYIDRIISDYYGKAGDVSKTEFNSMPFKLMHEERDDYYQIIRSKNNDLIAISTLSSTKQSELIEKKSNYDKGKDEDEKSIEAILPTESLHIYYKKDQVQIICNDKGLFINVKEAMQINVDGEARIKVKNGCYIDSNVGTWQNFSKIEHIIPDTIPLDSEDPEKREMYGSLKINLTPNTGFWKTSSNDDIWNASSSTKSLVYGDYTITYKDLDGYAKPSNEDITINSSTLVELNRGYKTARIDPPTETGLCDLTVILASTGGHTISGGWRSSGYSDAWATWKASGTTMQIPYGTWKMYYQSLEGFVPPGDVYAVEDITLNTPTLTITRYYTPY